MPTPTPAKQPTSRSGAQRFVPLLAAALALAFVAHHFSSSERPHDVPPASGVPRDEVPAPPRDSVAPLEAATATASAPTLDLTPEAVAAALPRDDADLQRLTVLEIRALVSRGQIGSARAHAESYFERWPNGPDTAALEQLTGAHPRR